MTSATSLPGAFLALIFLASPSFSHDFWISKGRYSSPTGEHCCGDYDCSALDANEVSITSGGYALTTGEVVPFSEAIGSEDGQFWRCKRYDGSRRCFFAPQPSS